MGMNSAKILMTSVAIALLAGTGGAVAQQQPSGNAPAEKMAPQSSGKQPSAMQHQNEGTRSEGSKGRSETTGQAPHVSEQNKSDKDGKAEHGKKENLTSGHA